MGNGGEKELQDLIPDLISTAISVDCIDHIHRLRDYGRMGDGAKIELQELITDMVCVGGLLSTPIALVYSLVRIVKLA